MLFFQFLQHCVKYISVDHTCGLLNTIFLLSLQLSFTKYNNIIKKQMQTKYEKFVNFLPDILYYLYFKQLSVFLLIHEFVYLCLLEFVIVMRISFFYFVTDLYNFQSFHYIHIICYWINYISCIALLKLSILTLSPILF